MERFVGIAGMAALFAIAVLLSSNRRAIRPRVVIAAFALQAAIAVLVLYVPIGRTALQAMSNGVVKLLGYSREGSRLVFGADLVNSPYGAGFAISALPAIIFFASLISVLYYLGVMQLLIKWIGGGIRHITGISRVESLAAAANIFVGQPESPLVVRPYLAAMTRSQLFVVMSVGMAGIAGSVLALYYNALGPLGPRLLPYLVAACFMSAPGGILMAKIMEPDDVDSLGVDPDVHGEVTFGEEPSANIFMAAAEGAQTGMKLAVAIATMVIAFPALIALVNALLGGLSGLAGYPDLSLQQMLGALFSPIIFLFGTPWPEAERIGLVVGNKVVLTELVGFIALADQAQAMSERAIAIATFALCGFANFLSIAIQIAVTGGLAPNQRALIARLGPKALVAGTLSNLMSAALAAMLIGA